jgi:hypothetical protein
MKKSPPDSLDLAFLVCGMIRLLFVQGFKRSFCQNLNFAREKNFSSIARRYQNAFDNFYHLEFIAGIAVFTTGPYALAHPQH